VLALAAPAEADDFALVRLEGSTEVTRPGCETVLVMVTMGVLVVEVEDEVDVVDGMTEEDVELELGATEVEDDEGRAEDELEAMAEELETAADDATGGSQHRRGTIPQDQTMTRRCNGCASARRARTDRGRRGGRNGSRRRRDRRDDSGRRDRRRGGGRVEGHGGFLTRWGRYGCGGGCVANQSGEQGGHRGGWR
jgi:hypothetical protein